ncbi:protein charybde-like [Daphnia carinata]|uniref:protein charybde-like n=1 Tax=Daphnia carinata TaxID=120202 RepID=UPI00257EE733|nr:protein charybde-like [Daphnia carinata]
MEVMPLPVTLDFTEDVWNLSLEDAEEQTARDVLAELLAAELRQARARYRLSNGQQQRAPNEILLPAGILQSIARDILIASVDEPCGIRGCMVFIDFEEPNSRNNEDRKQRIGAVKCHPYTVNTFELYLTLRPHSSWTSKLPLFLQNLAYRSTMVISQDYSLVKRKLFRSSSQ